MKTTKLLFLFWLSLTTGCATIINNKPQGIRISTTDSKTAIAEVDAPDSEPYKIMVPNIIYATPSSFKPLRIAVSDPCFMSQSIIVNKSIDPAYWANIFTYFIGFPVDYMSGHMWDYDFNVNLPLTPVNDASIECGSQNKTPLNLVANPIPKPIFKRHKISWGFGSKTHSKRYPDAYSGFGTFLEYVYMLNREFMLSVRFQANSSSEFYYDDCLSYCYADIYTDQEVYALSLRRYITPASNFYTGLGVAQVNIEQEYWGDNFIFTDSTISAQTSAIFLDLGWQTRDGRLTLSVNGMVDFSDLRLSSPSFKYDDEDLSKYEGKHRRTEAINRFRNAGIISNVNLGLTITF